MPTEPHSASVSTSALWAGGIITGLVVLFLAFDGVTKIIKVTPVMEACEELGVPSHTVAGIGVLARVELTFAVAARGPLLLGKARYLGGGLFLPI